VVAKLIRGRRIQPVVADVVDIQLAVVVVEHADSGGPHRVDVLEGHADRIDHRNVERLERAFLMIAAPELGGRDGRTGV
jgi:hypothetical protein